MDKTEHVSPVLSPKIIEVEEPVMKKVKRKSKSPAKKFVKDASYLKWTNSFSRSTVLWDKNGELLETEKKLV
jgi:hypothetical protein